MKKRINKFTAFTLCCLLAISAGCSAGKTAPEASSPAVAEATSPAVTETSAPAAPAEEQSSGAAADTSAPEWKADTSPITLTAYIDFPQDTYNGWGKDAVSAEITKRTGVTIDLRCATTDDSQELNMMMSSNDLPDFVIINWQSPLRQILWKQEFVKPLNKLIDQYCPSMRDIIDPEYFKIYTEPDGNLYMLVDYYSDIKRIAGMKAVILTYDPFSINEKMYKELGSPDISTLEQYHDVLLQAKEKFPDVQFLVYDSTHDDPNHLRNMANIISRLYGAENMKVPGADGSIHMGFRDEPYQKALKYINSLYRDGLFNKENFTVTNEEQYKELVLNQQIFTYWGQSFNIYRYDMSDTGAYIPFEVPKADNITPKFSNNNTAIGGWHGVHISANTKNEERAIKYLQFMESDEGQMLMNFGIEGTHYNMEENYPHRVPDIQAAAEADWSNFTKTYGIYNYNIQWLASAYTDSLEYYWASKTNKMYRLNMNSNKYANNERIFDLTIAQPDSDEKVIETKILDLWKVSLPKMYLAASEDECMAAYNEFIKQAEDLGLATLEAAYTKNYKEWKAKLG